MDGIVDGSECLNKLILGKFSIFENLAKIFHFQKEEREELCRFDADFYSSFTKLYPLDTDNNSHYW